jgi:hypothetical protein
LPTRKVFGPVWVTCAVSSGVFAKSLPSRLKVMRCIRFGFGEPVGLAMTVKNASLSALRNWRSARTAYFVATKVNGSNGSCFSSVSMRLVRKRPEARCAVGGATSNEVRWLERSVPPSGV